MGGEQGLGPYLSLVADELQHRLGNGHAVKGGGAAADLIEDDEALLRRVFQDGGHLVHFHHEGGLAGGEVVGGAHPGKDAVADGDPGAGGRHEAAGLGHEDDEGHLPHVGGLTGHVRSGDDGGLFVLEVEVRVVGHKGRALQHLLDHRVPAVLDDDGAVLGDFWTDIAVLDGHFGKGAQDVEGGDGTGGLLDAYEALCDRFADSAEQFVFELRNAFLGSQDLRFEFLEFSGDIAFGVGQGLLADPFLGHIALERTRHFQIVAEDFVVTNFQFGNAGALPLLRLNGGKVPLAVLHDVAQLVQLFAVAGFDHAAFADGEGRVFVNGLLNEFHDVFEGVDVPFHPLQEPGLRVCQQGLNGLEALHGLPEASEFPRVGRAVGDAGDEPLHVVDRRHVLREFISEGQVVYQGRHRILPFGDAARGQKRLFQPGAQQTLAHGGAGLVHDPEKGAPLLPVPERFGQLQVPPGGEVQLHIFGIRIVLHFPNVRKVGLLDLVEIVQSHTEGSDGVLRGQFHIFEVFVEVVGNDLLEVFQARLRLLQDPQARPLLFFTVGLETFEFGGLGVAEEFPGRKAAEVVDDPLPVLGLLELRQLDFAGGDVHEADAGLPFCVEGGTEIVVLRLVEHGALNDGAGGDDADDFAPHEPLGEGRVLRLFTDGDFIPFGDQAGDVRVHAVEGHTAHGGALLLAAVLAGEDEVQHRGHQLRVVEEHLVEVSDAVHENGIFVVLFDREILFHHGGEFRHWSHSFCKLALQDPGERFCYLDVDEGADEFVGAFEFDHGVLGVAPAEAARFVPVLGEHPEGAALHAGGALRRHLFLGELQLFEPLLLLGRGHRVRHTGAGGADSGRIDKRVQCRIAHLSDEADGVEELFVGLSREPDDDVAGNGEVRHDASGIRDGLEVLLAVVVTVHAVEDFAVAGLDRQVQVVFHLLTRRHGVEEGVRAVPGVGGHKPDDKVSGDVVDVLEQLREEFFFAEVLAVRVDVLAEEHDLLVACRREGPGICQDVLVLPAPLSAPDVGHDAEGAEVVAAVGDGQERLERMIVPDCKSLGNIVVVFRNIEDPSPFGQKAVQELRHLVLDMCAEDEVDVREVAFEAFGDMLLLDHAAAEGNDEVRVRLLELLEAADVSVDPLFRVLPHRAGVEEDEVRFVRAVRELVAHLFEEAVDALAVRHIALAPVGVGKGLRRLSSEAFGKEAADFCHIFKLAVQLFLRHCQNGHQLS